MALVKKILYPVDFTESSEKIVPFVKEFVKNFDAELHVIHVIRSAEDFAGFEMGAAWYAAFEKDLMDGAEKSMARFVEEQFNDIGKVNTFVVVGDVVDEIIEYIEKNDIDLVTLGTHGRKGLEKVMFGSVAEGVVGNAPCPVLTINPYKVKKIA